MLLAIDIRNRSIFLGFRDKGAWLARRRIASQPLRSADEYSLLLKAFSSELGKAVSSVWISSVVPSLTMPIREAVEAAFGLGCTLVGPGVKTGVKLRTDLPTEVGSDLVCAALAAYQKVKKAAIVLSFDAAIASSAIGRNGDFLGVAIAPGFFTGFESLKAATALLPEIPAFADFSPSSTAIGKTTAQSLRSGLCLGYAGLVERIVRSQIAELISLKEADSEADIAVLGSGGEEGSLIFSLLGWGEFLPDLALEGLAILAERQAVSKPLLA